MSLFDDYMELKKDLTTQADSLFIKYINEALPNDIKDMLAAEKLIKDGVFSDALKACVEKRPEHKTYLLIVALYFFWCDENAKQSDNILNMHALALAQTALANVALKQAAELIAKGKDAEAGELLNNDVTAQMMAAMSVPDIIQKPKKAAGGKKGGGSNKINATREQIIKAYEQLQRPKHERASILAQRFQCDPKTIRNYLKKTT